MKTKKIYITLALVLPLFLMWCSIDSMIPNKESVDTTVNNIEDTITQIQDKVDTAWKKIEAEVQKIKTRGYENKTENFSFDFADGREFKENQFGFNTIVYTPKDDDIKENVGIAVQHLQKFLSKSEYYEETVNNLKETLNEFKEISAKDITQDWMEWKTITYEYSEQDKVLNSQQTFLMGKDNTVYIINYTATKETFDKFIKWVQKIITSFKITK
jgi:hypothetical protein